MFSVSHHEAATLTKVFSTFFFVMMKFSSSSPSSSTSSLSLFLCGRSNSHFFFPNPCLDSFSWWLTHPPVTVRHLQSVRQAKICEFAGKSNGLWDLKPEGKSAECSVLATERPRETNFLFYNLTALWTGDADLRLCVTTVEDGWRTSAFLTRARFPRTIHFNYAIHAAFLRMVLLTDVYRNVTSLRSNDLW